MAAAAGVISPVAPLRQTFQDIIAEAELVISLAAVDALQGDLHQLVRVPDDLLLALQTQGKTNVCVFTASCISAAFFFPLFVVCVCVCV